MCGIAGLVRLSPAAPPLDPAELARISAALARRGPDGAGEWHAPSGRAALAHRRLAILDLSPAAAQPMRSADGRFTIVFNGEIYDFRARRAELARAGVSFRTESDTELVVELVARQGLAALGRLRGMYACALWDESTGELLLARDPHGIKPLYYALEGGVLRFASQVRALAAGGALSTTVDPAAVAGFLAWGSIPEPRTLHRAIRALPAGYGLVASAARGVRIEKLPSPVGEEAGVEPFADSVAAHLVSDVPVALFLSAGLDSALVAALVAAQVSGSRGTRGTEPPTALTLTFAEARAAGLDETPLARAVAERLGFRHVVREVDGAEVRALLPEILAAMDQPSIDGFNTFLVARLAREEGFKVALSGLGGDELLGGYPSFADVPRWQRRARTLARLPGARALLTPLARLAGRPKLAGFVAHGRSLAGAYFLRRGLFLPAEIARLGIPSPSGYDPVLDAWERLGEESPGAAPGILLDPWRAVQRLESKMYLKNQLLRDADWAGMAHGVEIRVPLVDARLSAAVERADFEPARSGGKRALVRALAPELPAELFTRSKSGFHLPIADWLEPPTSGRPRPIADQSRRLALLVLEAFGVKLGELRGA